MKKIIYIIIFGIHFFSYCYAQKNCIAGDTAINNLMLPSNYKPSDYASIPEYKKIGAGKQTLILIPGLGFDGSIFNDFTQANKKHYTIYCITTPGYGKTSAPQLPQEGTSFGEQNWNKSLLSGLIKLIEKEKIEHPIIVGHFVQGTQIALRMAIDYPDKIGGVIILGGAAKFILISEGKPVEYPLQSTINYIDKNTAPNWFKTISKKSFDQGNYLPEIYSLDSLTASTLWKQTASVPLSVMVQSLCEFLASDITLQIDKIKCPVLIVRAMFNESVLQKPINNYVKPQFIDSWNKVVAKNALITIKDINDAATCVWKDKPNEVYNAIQYFIENNINTANK